MRRRLTSGDSGLLYARCLNEISGLILLGSGADGSGADDTATDLMVEGASDDSTAASGESSSRLRFFTRSRSVACVSAC